MRSKARQILSSVRQRLLFILISIFSTFLISANGEIPESEIVENTGGSRIYYVTIPIDRSNGPFLRQLKILIPDVPTPHNNTQFYDGDTWEGLVDKLLTKKDSVVRGGRSLTQVIVPMPAACFDSGLSSARRDQCLNDPRAFAKGYLSLKLYDVKSGESLPDVFSRHGVYPSREGSSYFNQQRWPDVVQNFNPRIRQWNNLPAGAVFVLPIINESESRAREATRVAASNAVASNVEKEQPTSAEARSSIDPVDSKDQKLADASAAANVPETLPTTEVPVAPAEPEAVPTPSDPPIEPIDSPKVNETAPAVTKPAPLPVAGPSLPQAKPAQLPTPKQVKPAAPAPVEIVEPEIQAPEPEPVPLPTKRIGLSRESTSDVSIGWARNVLSSAKIPMVAKQNNLNLAYTHYDAASASDTWLNLSYSPKVTAKSASSYLMETDDPSEYFAMGSVEYGTKFHLAGMVPNWSIYAGIYGRLVAMNIRYHIDNESDEVAYLVDRNTKNNLGMGVTAGVDHYKRNGKYRFSVMKDLYEFVDQTVQIDRTNARLSGSFYYPSTKTRGKIQRHFDLFMESETVDVNLVSEAVLLQVTMKRFSFGLGGGLVW